MQPQDRPVLPKIEQPVTGPRTDDIGTPMARLVRRAAAAAQVCIFIGSLKTVGGQRPVPDRSLPRK